MSFEDYVQHITNKYKVAAAIAVLKSKPEELTIEEHTANLKAKIQNKMDVDCDVTPEEFLCSQDFEFHETDFETQVVDKNDSSMVGSCPEDFEIRDKSTDFREVNDFNDIEATVAHVGVSDSEMQVDESHAHGRQEDETNSLMYVLKTLQEIDQNAALEKVPITATQNTFCEASQSILTQMFGTDAEIINFHVDTSTGVVNLEYEIENDSDNCTFDNRIVSKVASNLSKGLIERSSEAKSEMNYNTVEEKGVNQREIPFNHDLEEDLNSYKIINNVDTDESVKREFIKEKAITVTRNIRNEFVTTVPENPYEVITTNQTQDVIDTQATILYSLHGFTENNTQISQSQNENIEVSSKFITGNKNINVSCDNKVYVTENNSQDALPSNSAGVTHARVITIDSSQLKYILDKNTGKTYAVLPSMNFDSNNELNFQEDVTEKNENTKDTNCSAATNSQNSEGSRYGTSQTDEDLNKNEESSDKEIVPFKVIKELAKVKAFLKKRERRTSNDENLTDSGYRSDSQYSFRSASAPAPPCSEAAHCLCAYVRGCRLQPAHTDILHDIAQVLGAVIDRHHSEEKYPPYIEQLMEHIAALVGGLYTGGGGDDHILQKDETIQRLLLMNHSRHILEYTIDKITTILQDTHTKLTTNHLYELENITQVENLCYIFYLLEILIQKYNSVKNSETTHSSQSQEKVLKKSSITDIWKKKWNSNSKEVVVEGSQKISVMSKCSEILNKIVIDCMEGYSLVAFAALQCFNLLQS